MHGRRFEVTGRQMARSIEAHQAYLDGDLAALRRILGDPPDFPNCLQPVRLGVGGYPLEYAIYWSPLAFIKALISLEADVNYSDEAGFPSLIAVLSAARQDGDALLTLLLDNGADTAQRGINDWTPLHMAVAQKASSAIELLLRYGAKGDLRTRIDDCSTALEDAEASDWRPGIDLLREDKGQG